MARLFCRVGWSSFNAINIVNHAQGNDIYGIEGAFQSDTEASKRYRSAVLGTLWNTPTAHAGVRLTIFMTLKVAKRQVSLPVPKPKIIP